MAKRKMVKTVLDNQIAELSAKTDHTTLTEWACDCVERVLPYFEKPYPEDDRPRLAIKAARHWISTGVFRMAHIRKASLEAHKAASEVKDDDAARSAARAAGQALATAHVPRHAIAAAIYAATAVRDGTENHDVEADVMKEREWQYQQLLELNEEDNRSNRGARPTRAFTRRIS